jgi:hypothetical protein
MGSGPIEDNILSDADKFGKLQVVGLFPIRGLTVPPEL